MQLKSEPYLPVWVATHFSYYFFFSFKTSNTTYTMPLKFILEVDDPFLVAIDELGHI